MKVKTVAKSKLLAELFRRAQSAIYRAYQGELPHAEARIAVTAMSDALIAAGYRVQFLRARADTYDACKWLSPDDTVTISADRLTSTAQERARIAKAKRHERIEAEAM